MRESMPALDSGLIHTPGVKAVRLQLLSRMNGIMTWQWSKPVFDPTPPLYILR